LGRVTHKIVPEITYVTCLVGR